MQPDSRQMEELMTAADMGWWSYDFQMRAFRFSAFLCRLLGLKSNTLGADEWKAIIHEDYRIRLYAQFAGLKGEMGFNQRFPIMTPDGEVWLHVVFARKEYDPQSKSLTAVGTARRIRTDSTEEVARLTLENNYEALQKEAHHTNQLLDYLPIGYFRLKLLYDKQNRPIDYLFVNVNRKAGHICGEDPSAFIGKTAKEIGLPVDAHIDFLAGIPSGEHVLSEWTSPVTQRQCHNYSYNTPEDDSDIVILLLDVTETVNTHKTLDASENLLHNVFLSIPVGVVIYDPSGRLTKANAKWMQMFGIEAPDSILGLNIYESPNIPEAVKQTLREGRDVDFTAKYDLDNIGDFYRTEHHGVIDCTFRIRHLYDAKGALECLLCIVIDDTQLNRTSLRIAQFEDMSHHISSFARVGYANYNLLTKEGYAQGIWHENYGEKAGIPLHQIVGEYRHLHPEDRRMMKKALRKFTDGTISSLDKTLRILHKDGSTTWTRTTLICRYYAPQEKVIEMIGINYDITELILSRQQAEETNRLKSAFMSSMSHEIRTPLNAIVGFSELLATQASSEAERCEYIGIVRHNNELLLQIVSDILDLAKIEAGSPLPTADNINIADICRSIALVFAPQTPEGIKVSTDGPLPECLLTTSRHGVLQILENFTNNALKFTEQGTIRIGLCEHQTEVEVYVQDTGIGISAAHLSRIFERFFKVSPFSQGTGLGLAICKGLADQLGGRINAVSTLGLGSRFSLYLPKK